MHLAMSGYYLTFTIEDVGRVVDFGRSGGCFELRDGASHNEDFCFARQFREHPHSLGLGFVRRERLTWRVRDVFCILSEVLDAIRTARQLQLELAIR
jgi:hypothetical protein